MYLSLMGVDFPESLLHFIWQFRLFDESKLKFIDGAAVRVVSPGMHHRDAGPDFRNARLQTDDALWVGNVESHIRSSDWYRHQHQTDEAYDYVIAHVVFENDALVSNRSGVAVPCIELKDVIPPLLFERYRTLMSGMFDIPCSGIGRTDVLTLHNWLDRLLVERLESRSDQVKKILEICKFDWQETLHVFIFRAMGMQVNQLPFEMLARNVPAGLLRQYAGSTYKLESILLGCAGFLSAESRDVYTDELKSEFEFLRKKHRLKVMELSLWKFLRMRPMNFPTIRIAQLASMYSTQTMSPSELSKLKDVRALRDFFSCRASPYWDAHYRLGESSAFRPKTPGKQAIENALINAVIPLMFEYARHRGDSVLRERCLEWLYELKPENNQVVRAWIRPGIEPDSAAASQALLQLKRFYCDERRCLDCAVGHKLLKDTLRIN